MALKFSHHQFETVSDVSHEISREEWGEPLK